MGRKRQPVLEIQYLESGITFCEDPATALPEFRAAVIQDFQNRKIYVVADIEKERPNLLDVEHVVYSFPVCVDGDSINDWLRSNEDFLCTLPLGFKLKEEGERVFLECEYGRLDEDERANALFFERTTKIHNSLLIHALLNNRKYKISSRVAKILKDETRDGKESVLSLLLFIVSEVEQESSLTVHNELFHDFDFLKEVVRCIEALFMSMKLAADDSVDSEEVVKRANLLKEHSLVAQ